MRRFFSRAAATTLLALGVVTCSESPTSVQRSAVRLVLAPRFTAAAAAIYGNLGAFSVELDNVHLVARGVTANDAPGPALKDTVVAFPEGEDQITIGVDLDIAGMEQGVLVQVELREESTTYFSGSQILIARRGESTTPAEPVDLSYTGPGSTAELISVLPGPVTLAPSATFAFTAQVLDHLERPVADLPLTWSTGDPTIVSVSSTGLVRSSGKAGTTSLTVRGLNGITAEVPIGVRPVARLAVTSGDAQAGVAGSTLGHQFDVQAMDATGEPVAGATIGFAAPNGGSVSPASATTDANGHASTSVMLGSTAATYSFTAAVAGSSAAASITAEATAGSAASLTIAAGNSQTDTVLATLAHPLTVKVTDALGNPVPGQIVQFDVASGIAGLLPANDASSEPVTSGQVATGSDGIAAVRLATGNVAGNVRVTASLPNTTVASVAFDETLRPGVAARLVMLQQPDAKAQATITLGTQPRVQVTDLYGNAVAVAGLAITAEPGLFCEGSACAVGAVMEAGAARFDRGTTPGSLRRASATPPRRLTGASATESRLAIPRTIARTRSVSDTFQIGLGGRTVVETDANGVATFTDLAMNLQVVSGTTWRLLFFDPSRTFVSAISDDIILSPGPITSIVAWSRDTSFVVPDTVPDTLFAAVRVIDPVGNGIPGVEVDWAVNDGVSKLDSTVTKTNADGVATPGLWIVPSNLRMSTTFDISAMIPVAPKAENAPLHLYAVPLPGT